MVVDSSGERGAHEGCEARVYYREYAEDSMVDVSRRCPTPDPSWKGHAAVCQTRPAAEGPQTVKNGGKRSMSTSDARSRDVRYERTKRVRKVEGYLAISSDNVASSMMQHDHARKDLCEIKVETSFSINRHIFR